MRVLAVNVVRVLMVGVGVVLVRAGVWVGVA
jgi:hypothetical protein